MANVAQVEQALKHILEERAKVLARETGCIERQRKFNGADRLANVGFWLAESSECQLGNLDLHGSHPRGVCDRYSRA